MRHGCILLALCCLPSVTFADIVDERLRAQVEAELDAKPAADRADAKVDKEKFEDAAERREKRREDALEARRQRSENKSHVYTLTQTLVVPGPIGPFNLQRDINRGTIIDTGGGGGGVDVITLRAVRRGAPTPNTLKILFLQDAPSISPEVHTTYLAEQGLSVVAPGLPIDDFAASIRAAEFVRDRYQPDVIVAHSRAAAVAMNMDSGATPLVLLAPQWKRPGGTASVKPKSIILHAANDPVVPFGWSQELATNSGLAPNALIAVGNDHQLGSPTALQTLLGACVVLGFN